MRSAGIPKTSERSFPEVPSLPTSDLLPKSYLCVAETPCDIDAELARIQGERDKRAEEGNPDLRLRLAGVSKFVDLGDKYLSE